MSLYYGIFVLIKGALFLQNIVRNAYFIDMDKIGTKVKKPTKSYERPEWICKG
jgi:hypothetical protein